MNETETFPNDGIEALDAYWRAANFLGAAQVYLRDNCLLEEPLCAEHVKPRLLGHWGTVPGINFVCAHLNRLIRHTGAGVLLVTGPGHGAPANLANLFLDGTLAEFHPELTRDRAGAGRLVRGFSWPGGFPSHLSPATPGCIHEGGELGYALATSFGAALDNPDLLVACVVGDGEAETGPTATAWHGTKFLNPARDGAVLPVLHLNGYKISSTTIFGAMSDEELNDLFQGYGYQVEIVEANGSSFKERVGAHRRMAAALDWAYATIRSYQRRARRGESLIRPRYPLLILRSPKGWTCPKTLNDRSLEGSYRSHQVPLGQPQEDSAQLHLVEQWLMSYRPRELFDSDGRPAAQLLATCPTENSRMGMNVHSYGGRIRRELRLPDFRKYAVQVSEHGAITGSDTKRLGEYLRDVINLDADNENQPASFRIFCPDEMTSNRLNAVFEVTDRQFAWPTNPQDDSIGTAGRVMEILSEHTCQGWLQG